MRYVCACNWVITVPISLRYVRIFAALSYSQEKTLQNIEGFDKHNLKHATTQEKNPLPDPAGLCFIHKESSLVTRAFCSATGKNRFRKMEIRCIWTRQKVGRSIGYKNAKTRPIGGYKNLIDNA